MITLGGNAELELVDSLDPFSEGIIFSVMPPKKSWKNISNLSGGEKVKLDLYLYVTWIDISFRRWVLWHWFSPFMSSRYIPHFLSGWEMHTEFSISLANASVFHGRDRCCAWFPKRFYCSQLHQRPNKERSIYYHLPAVRSPLFIYLLPHWHLFHLLF